jgi:hypothetical protein
VIAPARHASALRWFVLVVLLLATGTVFVPVARAAPEDFGFDSIGASVSTSAAGAHPDLTTSFTVKGDASQPDSNGFPKPYQVMRDLTINLPPGLIGNPEAFPRCTVEQLTTPGPFLAIGTCPTDSQVGVTVLDLYDLSPNIPEPVYNMEPPGGSDVVARLGFVAGLYPTFIDISVRSDDDYGLTAKIEGSPSLAILVSADTTLWGVPADPSHDALRMTPFEAVLCGFPCQSDNGTTRSSGLTPRPFMSNPTGCGPTQVSMAIDGYQRPDLVDTASTALPPFTSCDRVPFDPTISLQPTTASPDSSSGLDVTLGQDQSGLDNVSTLAPAHLKRAVVTLPAGMSVNTSAADGLEGCTEAQIGLISESPIRFDTSTPTCPDASKVGTAQITTPLLPDPLEGSLYLAAQNDNPFHSLLTGYLVAQGEGVTIKLAGRFDLNPHTGRITATFDNNPQQPFSDLKLHFNGGSRGVLVTPSQCGTFAIDSQLTPWSGTPPVDLTTHFTIDQNCQTGGFAPRLNAGLTNPVAGSSSSFVLRLTRSDGEQNVGSIDTVLPPGLLAKLAGVPLCPDAQAATGDCPAGSQVGSTTVGVGAGSTPLYIPQAGKSPTAVYLAGPYKGAPYSLVIRVPAQAGPFDLGTVAVRAALFVDPTDAHVTVKSDPLPQIIQGIPLSYRDIRVTVDRPGFIQAPTSCDPMQIAADVTGAPLGGPVSVDGQGVGFSTAAGTVAHLTDRFQVGGCSDLKFAPKLKLKLTGKRQTTDGKHPALVTTLSQGAGQANIRSANVALPLSLALDPNNSQHVCDHDQAAAVHGGRVPCPASTIVGKATAITPLLPHPLSGNVYLVQGLRTNKFGRTIRTLPTLLVPLRGPDNVAFDLRAHTNVVKNKLVTTFENIPDAAVSQFTLTINGGRRGILVVTHHRNLCRGKQITNASLGGQNGKRRNQKLAMTRPCVKHKALKRTRK